jgi:hypothetical protein
MTDQTEELLRAGMERFTADTDLPSGLAARATRHRQRGKRARAAAAIGAAAAAAVTAVVVTLPGPAPRVQTAAYVVSRVQGALAQASSQNVIEYGHETSTGPIFFGEKVSTRNAAFWVYRGQSRSVAYGPGGKIIAAIGRVPEGRDPKEDMVTDTMVNYQERTWWRDSHAVVAPPWATPSSASACAEGTTVQGGGAWISDVAAKLRIALSCGQYVVAGHQRVDGVLALELRPAKQGPMMTAVFWVDPSTYLPVRDQVTAGRYTITDDYRWLPPTQANRAALGLRVPPGFIQVAPQDR